MLILMRFVYKYSNTHSMKGVTAAASLIDGGNYVLIWSMINNDTQPYLMSSIMGGDPLKSGNISNIQIQKHQKYNKT